MRPAIVALREMGPLPTENPNDSSIELLERYGNLLHSIEHPVTDDEARVLVTLFGNDDCFGLAWFMLHLVETAPSWHLLDCLENVENEWIARLRTRLRNAG